VDLKTGGIAAAVAFGLSFLIGFLSRSTMPYLIIWPLVFAAIFFVLVIAAKFLFGQFLPELLEDDSGSNAGIFPGSVVNIMEGDSNTDEFSSDDQGSSGSLSWQSPDAARPDESDKSIGDISALSEVVARNKAVYKEATAGAAEGLDQNLENGYTALGEVGNFSQSAPLLDFEAAPSGAADASPARAAAKPAAKPAKTSKPRSAALYSDSDDSLPDLDSMAGVFTSSSADEEPETAGSPEPARQKKSANREQSLEGNFSPEDIAKGIRTVLQKDKEE
jgi:hypothetical protein